MRIVNCIKGSVGESVVDVYWLSNQQRKDVGQLLVVLESEPQDLDLMYQQARTALEELDGVTDVHLELTLTSLEKSISEPYIKSFIKKAKTLTTGRH